MSSSIEILKSQPHQLWIVSVPEIGSDLSRNLTKSGLDQVAKVCNFNIPKENLRVGTLDQLIDISDDISRIENQSDQLAKRLANYLYEVICGEEEDENNNSSKNKDSNVTKLVEGLKLNQNKHNVNDFVKNFKWDMAKYPCKGKLLKDILSDLAENISRSEATFKKKNAQYSNVCRELSALYKRQTGSLLTRDLSALIDQKKHLVQNSEYLETLVVAVPNNSKKDWLQCYEQLTDYVVPRSSQEIESDSDYTLYTVTLFQRVVDEFKNHCAGKRFIVRDISKDQGDGDKDMTPDLLIKKYKKQRSQLYPVIIKWLQAAFRDAISIMVHIKVLKCFIASVLRYGLPVKFDSILLTPPAKQTSKLSMILDDTFKSQDSLYTSDNNKNKNNAAGMEGINIGFSSELNAEYKPYVFNTINVDFAANAIGLNNNV